MAIVISMGMKILTSGVQWYTVTVNSPGELSVELSGELFTSEKPIDNILIKFFIRFGASKRVERYQISEALLYSKSLFPDVYFFRSFGACINGKLSSISLRTLLN